MKTKTESSLFLPKVIAVIALSTAPLVGVTDETSVKGEASAAENTVIDVNKSTDGFSRYANEQELKQTLKEKLNGLEADDIFFTPFDGVLEVQVGRQIIYTDPDASFIMQGGLIDVATKTDLTAQRLELLNTIDIEQLNLDNAIKTVKGDGSRILFAFEDPNCVFCQRFHNEVLPDLDNVTIYSFLYPILSDDSVEKAKTIWCAPDKTEAMSRWMTEQKMPALALTGCENPIDENLELGESLNITGTPAFIFGDGTLGVGLMQPKMMQDRLESKK